MAVWDLLVACRTKTIFIGAAKAITLKVVEEHSAKKKVGCKKAD